MDRRLQKRYVNLVKAQMRNVSRTAAGPCLPTDGAKSFAAAQASWRFCNNPRVKLPALAEPLREVGRKASQLSSAGAVLLIHDWSKLDYRRHSSKRDVAQLTHDTDIGYELTTALLVDASDGAPLAPMEMHLKTGRGVLSTRCPVPADQHHLEQVLPTMQASRGWDLSKPVVHIIDREADSVGHYRAWHAAGHCFLIRGDDRQVLWQGKACLLSQIVEQLRASRAFRSARKISYQGRERTQYVAETQVVLHRPAKTRRDGKQFEQPGPPLNLRLVVAQVRNGKGAVLAEWLLLSNAPPEWASDADLAQWYYWRWRIESFFKLLKSSGHEIEHWQQETAGAIARRLLVAAMACVVVWELERSDRPEAEEMTHLLVRLSGRQMKRSRPVTARALLAGLYVLFSMLDLLEGHHGSLDHIRRLAHATIPLLNSS